MNFLLAEQSWWDERRFDPKDGYDELSPRDAKIAHIQLHVAKASLKLLINNPDTIKKEVVPDLAIYRSQIMNALDMRPDQIDEPYLLDRAPLNFVIRANGYLASYVEQLQHGEQMPLHPVIRGVEYLHYASVIIANHYDLDLESAQRTRMENFIGGPLPEVAAEQT